MLTNALKNCARSARATAARVVQSGRTQAFAILAIAFAGVFGIVSSSTAVVGSFAPTIDFQTSTSRATAHPDARITIDNTGSAASIRSLRVELPNGFWGSLDAVTTKCASFVAGSGTSGSDTCSATNKIGTVTTTATIDESDAVIAGDVFLVESADIADVAGIGFRVHAKVGGVDLGYVRVLGRVQMRGNVQGMNTVVENIPDSITDTHGRTVSFRLSRMTVDLTSDPDGPNVPLLTNPSSCGAKAVNAVANTSPTLGVGDYVMPPDGYMVTGCDSVKFSPTTFAFTPSGHASGSSIGFTNQIEFPTENASVKNLVVTLPAGLGPNFPSYEDAADLCPSATAPAPTSVFNPTLCPSRVSFPGQLHRGPARIGTVTIESPLLPDPVMGNVYMINKSPLPWLAIDVNPSIPGNPAGVTIRLLGQTNIPQRDPTCINEADYDNAYCAVNIFANFQNLPDAPVTSIDLDMNRGPRKKADESADIPGELLNIAAAGECQMADEVTAQFTAHSDSGLTPSRAGRVSTVSGDGCDADPVSFPAGPVGQTTDDTTPTFSLPETGTFYCAVNRFSFAHPGTTCSGSFTIGGLSNGFVYRLYAGLMDRYRAGDVSATRAFAVETVPSQDDGLPTTAINSGPSGDTADSTPTFTFSGTDAVTASGSLAFQCSVDGSIFLSCASGFTTETIFASDTNHTFAVRAQDAAGKVDPTPDTRTFKVVIPFAPAITVLSTTNVARAHPDLDITISNLSHEDVKDVTLKLPDGLVGGLQGAQELCAPELADAGSCPAGSKVGTVETEAVVDESIVRIDGEIFLTDRRQPGDAAGLSIKVPVVIQSIDMGDVIVTARVVTRGDMQGFDTMAVQVPKSIDPANSGNDFDAETDFDLRKMVIKVRGAPGAAQPFLTNSSTCGVGGKFEASFASHSGATGASTEAYPVVGCEALAFAPNFTASIKRPEGTPPNASDYQPVDLVTTINSQPGDAGLREASVLMPKPLTMDVTKIPPVCENAQFLVDDCPATSIIGNAVARSPLLLAGDYLSGPVYLLRGENTTMPRIYARLGGRVTVRVIGKTSFENQTQLRAAFRDLPDTPLNSFTMNISNLMSTMKAPCQLGDRWGYAVTGKLTGHNGMTSGVDSPFGFDCAGVTIKSSLKRGKHPKLKFVFRTRGSQTKLKSVKMRLPGDLSMNKRRLNRKLSLKVGGKRLQNKCFRAVNPKMLYLGLCGARAAKIELSFELGSSGSVKKLSSSKIKFTFADAEGKSIACFPAETHAPEHDPLREPIATPSFCTTAVATPDFSGGLHLGRLMDTFRSARFFCARAHIPADRLRSIRRETILRPRSTPMRAYGIRGGQGN